MNRRVVREGGREVRDKKRRGGFCGYFIRSWTFLQLFPELSWVLTRVIRENCEKFPFRSSSSIFPSPQRPEAAWLPDLNTPPSAVSISMNYDVWISLFTPKMRDYQCCPHCSLPSCHQATLLNPSPSSLLPLTGHSFLRHRDIKNSAGIRCSKQLFRIWNKTQANKVLYKNIDWLLLQHAFRLVVLIQ